MVEERLPDVAGGRGRLVDTHRELAPDLVGVHEPQPGRLEVRPEEGGLARAVGPGDGHDHGAGVEGRRHLRAAGRNSRFTNRPTVRFPPSSIRRRRPGRPGAGSKCGKGRVSR
jgi:hypothetical protein